MDPAPLRCWKCDYDMTGFDPEGECPECGARIDVNRPLKENLPLALGALVLGVIAAMLTPAMLVTGTFRNDSGLRLILCLLVAVLLTIPSFWLARKAEPTRPTNRRFRQQYPIVSYARLFSLGTDVLAAVLLILLILSRLGGQ